MFPLSKLQNTTLVLIILGIKALGRLLYSTIMKTPQQLKKETPTLLASSQSKTVVTNFVKNKLLPVLIVIAMISHLAIVVTELYRNNKRYARIDKLIFAVEGLNKGGTQNLLSDKELKKKDILGELAREIDKLQKKNLS